jgi:nicotinamide-nucleotide amidase
MTFPTLTLGRAVKLLDACRNAGLRVATAESCTGGLIAACLTEIAGSSDVVDRGFVTYSNEAKSAMLGVPPDLIVSVGAVSEEVACAMAAGALERSDAQIVIAVTGIAGPGGSTAGKPVGLVHHACARLDHPIAHRREVYAGDRAAIRLATLDTALDMLLEACRS